MTPPETRYAKSGDVRIAYQVTGNGPFELVFVPGFVSNLDLVGKSGLGPLLRALCGFLAPHSFRQAGHRPLGPHQRCTGSGDTDG